jgi:hypothetical protein
MDRLAEHEALRISSASTWGRNFGQLNGLSDSSPRDGDAQAQPPAQPIEMWHSDKTEFCSSLKWGTKGENVGTCIEIIVRSRAF